MKGETIKFTLPRELLKISEEYGISKQDVAKMARSFVTLELSLLGSKLNRKNVEEIDKRIKEGIWKDLKKMLRM